MADKNQNIEQELKELHEDLSVINEKAPEMMTVLLGVVKGIRLASEAPTPPKATA